MKKIQKKASDVRAGDWVWFEAYGDRIVYTRGVLKDGTVALGFSFVRKSNEITHKVFDPDEVLIVTHEWPDAP
jgi:hypothetical protein